MQGDVGCRPSLQPGGPREKKKQVRPRQNTRNAPRELVAVFRVRANRSPAPIYFGLPGRCIERPDADALSSEDRRRKKEGKDGVGKWKRDGT